MLTAATLGMAAYGVYAVAAGLFDLLVRSRMEVAADLTQVVFGLLLLLAAAFVRVVIPGGLALAIGALLGLQALAIHADVHTTGVVVPLSQIWRGALAAVLVLLAWVGAKRERRG